MEAIASNNEKICTGMGVLVRDSNNERWQYTIFCEYNDTNAYSYICINNSFIYCIPYANNEYLLGTDKDLKRKFKFGDKVKSNSIYDKKDGVKEIEGILIGINHGNKLYKYEVAVNDYDMHTPSDVYICSKIELIEE